MPRSWRGRSPSRPEIRANAAARVAIHTGKIYRHCDQSGRAPGSKQSFRALAMLEVPMRAFLAAVFAVTLISPVMAAEPHHKTVKHHPKTAQTEDSAPALKDDDSAADDSAMNIIILRPQAAPNPYSNPEPRMISDAWAQRT